MASLNVDREIIISEALEALSRGVKMGKAVEDYGIPASTLRGRQNGRKSRIAAKEDTRRLSNKQEKSLVNWILAEERAGRAPSRLNLQSFAQLIIGGGNDDTPIGNNWGDRFLQRHPEIKIKISESLEAARSNDTTAEALIKWYAKLERAKKELNVEAQHITNLDETGIAEGAMKSGKVIGISLTRYSIVTESDSWTWVSILEAITANGRRLTPVVIFTSINLQRQWFKKDFPE
ncbi:Fc.00g082070.m01.CDS01 [Cosmosporella sp. VM-42]